MAPSDTPGRKKRETQYFEVGVQGRYVLHQLLSRIIQDMKLICMPRRTGVTLKDSGVRDEFGLESAEGIFSSPAKQAPQSVRTGRPARHSDGTLTTSEDMDVGRSELRLSHISTDTISSLLAQTHSWEPNVAEESVLT
jgi:centromere protein C